MSVPQTHTPPAAMHNTVKMSTAHTYVTNVTLLGWAGQEKAQPIVKGILLAAPSRVNIDECSLEEKAYTRKNENCYNIPGSFVCVCPDGFEETEDACVQTAESKVAEESPAQPPSHEDL